jgi:hypothetical protein
MILLSLGGALTLFSSLGEERLIQLIVYGWEH